MAGKSHVNFYENIDEARMRLQDTVVMYDGIPHYIYRIYPHLDGRFRVYMEALPDGKDGRLKLNCTTASRYEFGDSQSVLDKWADDKEDPLVRKLASSAKFNKYRPFPLGMCNVAGNVLYAERTPTRNMHQGLTSRATVLRQVGVNSSDISSRSNPRRTPSQMFQHRGPDLYEAIMAVHPTASECLEAVKNPKIANTESAFDREFAFCAGPVKSLFLAYQTDLVASLPNRDLSLVLIDEEFTFLKEKIEALGCFEEIAISR